MCQSTAISAGRYGHREESDCKIDRSLNPLIVTQGLTKRYASFVALDSCDLEIGRGEVFGLLGPNGAGKSTLIRLLLGFLKPTSGFATINGLDCWTQRESVHRQTSYLPGDARLYRMLKGKRVLELFCDFRVDASIERATEIADRLELDLNRWVGLMSTGMRQKLAMAICLANEAPLLVMDEPTSNLDPTVRHTVLSMVREAKQMGRTVVFSSHVLSEIEEVCDRVGILRNGKLVHQASMSKLRLQHRIQARLRSELPELPESLKTSGITIRREDDQIEIDAPGELGRVLGWLSQATLEEMHVQPMGLRAIYDRYHRETVG